VQHTIVAVLTLLSLAALVAVLARRIKIPYSTALLVCGLLAGSSGWVKDIAFDPPVVFFVFLPTLLFQASVTTDVAPLACMARTVTYLTTVGVPVTVLAVGAMAHYLLGMPWLVALLFASIAAPADTVAVLAILREMRIPVRLAALLEGESLFIDGIALLLFNTVLVATQSASEDWGLGSLVQQFAWRALGGALLGVVCAYAVSRAMYAVKDHLVEVLLTSILAYGSYVGGELLGVSSAIAVVTAGLVVGNYGLKHTIRPTTQLTLMGFWNYSAFVVNSLLFLLCGLQVPLARLWEWKGPILLAYLVLLAGRSVAVLPCPLVSRLLGEAHIPRSWTAVMVWSDFYGSLSMALALSLPLSVPWRNEIMTMTFGVVLLSLILQGVTLRYLIQFLRLTETPEHQFEFDSCHGRMLAGRGVQAELKRLFNQGLISREVHDHLNSRYQVRASRTERQLKALYETHQELEDREYESVELQMKRLERSLVANAMRERVISDEAGLALLVELDEALARPEEGKKCT
jgi:CPA1 family monovalent cation:H+ antiporter